MSDIRFVTMLPDQVAAQWNGIRPLIEASLPPISKARPGRMAEVLASILEGRLVVHLFCRLRPEGLDIVVVLVTGLIRGFDSPKEDLLIYSIAGVRQVGRDDWVYGFELLKRYAKGKDCERIIAYTADKGVKDFISKMGGSVDYNLLAINIGGE